MALKTTAIPFTIFSPATPSHRPATEIRFSRWNNANAEKFLRVERAQKEIEDEIRRERRYNSASKIAFNNNNTTSTSIAINNETFKSIGTPSSPSRSSIPGKSSKYSKPPQNPNPKNPEFSSHPAFRRISKVSKISKVVPTEGEAGISIGDNGVSYRVPNAPFEFQYSYTETPKVKPLALREPPFLPFGPSTMPRPWTGRAPLPPSKKKLPEFDSFKLPPPHKKGVKPVQSPGPFIAGTGPKYVKSREEILGEPLNEEEIKDLIKGCLKTRRMLNMGRDGLTHNMLDNIQDHWKRRRVCKIKCKGVCTVDMDNVRQQLEEKTGGKVIYSRGGVLFLFRGRNYNYRNRPRYPLMLWKPVTPVYPRLIQQVPEGLELEEAREMRKRGRKLPPICKLGKNGVYSDLVNDVREAFEECELVRINCQGLNPSDYKKIGAKLKDLVPCILLSFELEHILMWRGRNWKSSLPNPKESKKSETDGETTSRPLDYTDSLTYTDSVTVDVQGTSELCGKKSLDEDVSFDMPKTGMSILGGKGVGLEGSEDLLPLPNPKESKKSETDGETTSHPLDYTDSGSYTGSVTLDVQGTPELCGKKSLDEDVSFDMSKTSMSIRGGKGVSLEGSGDPLPLTLTKRNDHPSAATHLGSAVMNTYGSEIISDNIGGADDGSTVMSVLPTGSPTSDDIITHNKLRDAEGSVASPSSICTEGVVLLLRQAIENGTAVILDDASLDANIIYERAVSLAKAAPPGPVFMRRVRKVLIPKGEKQESEDLKVEDVVPVLENKATEKKGSRKQKLRDFKEPYPDIIPHGSLKVDELAKLLA